MDMATERIQRPDDRDTLTVAEEASIERARADVEAGRVYNNVTAEALTALAASTTRRRNACSTIPTRSGTGSPRMLDMAALSNLECTTEFLTTFQRLSPTDLGISRGITQCGISG